MQNLSIEFLNADLLLPTIRESEKYKQAMNQGLTLQDMGQQDLAYPIEILANKVKQISNPIEVLAG